MVRKCVLDITILCWHLSNIIFQLYKYFFFFIDKQLYMQYNAHALGANIL